jgi:hypothetical protein
MVARASCTCWKTCARNRTTPCRNGWTPQREQPPPGMSQAERDGLIARARDVIEHIQRVVHQVRRMEQGAESVVQIHFSAQSHRTNNIMRTLTALTAIFLPLNLITGVFGMNFEARTAGHVLVRRRCGAHGFGVHVVTALGRDGGVHALVRFGLGSGGGQQGQGGSGEDLRGLHCQFS